MPRVRAALLSVSIALGGATVAAHPFSVSYAQFTIGQRTVTATIRLPLDDVDLLLRLDRDLDGRVSASEIETARPVISAYVGGHLHVGADGADLTPIVGALGVWRDPSGFEYLEANVLADGPGVVHVISIRSDFLGDLYPSHSTQGEIVAAGRAERFVFKPGAVYERRVADPFWMTPAIALAAVSVLLLLWFARRGRKPSRAAVVAAATVLVATAAHADVIMTASGLNTTLKTMERLKREAEGGAPTRRADATFELAVQADALASLMNEEVASHRMEQRELIDLALSRTKELGVAIAYHRDKKKFFYDGAAFEEYLRAAPRGAHAPDAEFTLLAYQFYQSEGSDRQQLVAAAEAKKHFLARYPSFKANAELGLYLAIDYRDLYRRCRDAHDTAAAENYRRLTRAEYDRVARRYPGTEQAATARQLLRRFDEETRQRP